MSKEKFTKGPWFYEEATGEIYSDNYAEIICDMLPTGDEEFDANAALVAASPDMYTELKEASKGLQLLIDNSAVNALYLPALYEQVERIEALLAKARGE